MLREWNFRLLLAFLTLGSLPLLAADTTTGVSYTIHHHYVAPRALGMGDAFVAVANDYNALFYNPAGLARREDGEVNLYFDAGMSTNVTKAQKEISDASNSSSDQSVALQKTMNVLESYYGKSMSVRLAPANAIWVRPHWGIGFIPADVSLEMTMHQNVGPAVNVTAYGDTTAAIGYGADFHGMTAGRTSWGITGKFVNRAYFSKTVTALELAADSNLVKKSDLQEGYTMDADVGFLFTPALPADGIISLLRWARPTFGAVIRNVGATGFKSSLKVINKDAIGEPEKLYRVLDVGTKWEYPDVWIFGGRGTLDIRDIGHPYWNLRKGTHVGFEFDWAIASWWKGAYRFGLNQGYLTYGASAMFSIFNIDFVSYAEDVGTYNQSVENRIYMVRLNMNF